MTGFVFFAWFRSRYNLGSGVMTPAINRIALQRWHDHCVGLAQFNAFESAR